MARKKIEIDGKHFILPGKVAAHIEKLEQRKPIPQKTDYNRVGYELACSLLREGLSVNMLSRPAWRKNVVAFLEIEE